jgi:hypothetical protein
MHSGCAIIAVASHSRTASRFARRQAQPISTSGRTGIPRGTRAKRPPVFFQSGQTALPLLPLEPGDVDKLSPFHLWRSRILLSPNPIDSDESLEVRSGATRCPLLADRVCALSARCRIRRRAPLRRTRIHAESPGFGGLRVTLPWEDRL